MLEACPVFGNSGIPSDSDKMCNSSNENITQLMDSEICVAHESSYNLLLKSVADCDGKVEAKLSQFDCPDPDDSTADSCHAAAGCASHHGRVIVGSPLVESIHSKPISYVTGAQSGDAMESFIAERSVHSHDLVEDI
ncbi:hypothetical protein Nepgr_013377 [Nepenthes gracilis]|uniref:Uncharacterized protein n=1 Tax=Nepenthes gracilis TaxID=150966 RepID=A0AAD3XP94_NEPGR|nr:hypothetical protein Nepgr_013377 [Nepenthes gracilis]